MHRNKTGAHWSWELGAQEVEARRERIARPFALCHADGYQGIGSALMGTSRSGMRLLLLLSILLLPLMTISQAVAINAPLRGCVFQLAPLVTIDQQG